MAQQRKRRIVYQAAPLPGAFMLISMLGFLVVTIYSVYGRINPTWGFTLDLIFVIMFIASVLSITPNIPTDINKKIT